jgi:uncharacterized membrane-anchored protein
MTVVALQIALIGSVVVAPAMTLINGKEVSLETVPVDPYDMFRGDYVSLRYEMNSNLPSPPPADGAIVYTALHKSGKVWKPRISSTERPRLFPGEVCIKGKYLASWCQIHYGIEQVFVQEKKGLLAERAKSLLVVAAVDKEGNAVIKRVDNGGDNLYDVSNIWTGRKPARSN